MSPESFTLIIANKNYSSWSMRPWVLLKQLGIPFTEVLLKFESAEWAARIDRLSPRSPSYQARNARPQRPQITLI